MAKWVRGHKLAIPKECPLTTIDIFISVGQILSYNYEFGNS